MRYIFTSLLIIVFFCSCSSNNTKNGNTAKGNNYKPIKPKGMMDQIKLADSVAIIYYNQPANPRFFKVAKLRKLKPLQGLMEEINGAFVSGFDQCESLGKLYFYGKGDIVDVVYFSNKADCMTFSWIKNGEKHFTRMGLSSSKMIDSLRNEAVEPRSRK